MWCSFGDASALVAELVSMGRCMQFWRSVFMIAFGCSIDLELPGLNALRNGFGGSRFCLEEIHDCVLCGGVNHDL
jgi:hypothetical protein